MIQQPPPLRGRSLSLTMSAVCDVCQRPRGKLVPQQDLYVFDPKASEKALRHHILEYRRAGAMTKGKARTMYDAACDLGSFLSHEEFVGVVQGDEALSWIQEPWEFCRTRMCPTIDQFWDRLWLQFTNQLKEEIDHGKC